MTPIASPCGLSPFSRHISPFWNRLAPPVIHNAASSRLAFCPWREGSPYKTLGLDGKVDQLKDCLIAKGYTQIFGLDYSDSLSLSLSLSTKITFIRLSMSWLFINGLFISWTLRMFFSMMTLRMKLLWKQLSFFCLRGSLVALYVSCVNHSMAWNNILEHSIGKSTQ